VDRSLNTINAYVDITESNAPTGATGVFVNWVTDDMAVLAGARKKGTSWDKYYLPQVANGTILVGLDANKKWQGKIEDVCTDFFTLGYFAGGSSEIVKTSTIG